MTKGNPIARRVASRSNIIPQPPIIISSGKEKSKPNNMTGIFNKTPLRSTRATYSKYRYRLQKLADRENKTSKKLNLLPPSILVAGNNKKQIATAKAK
jgi:hypothetical protein